MTGSSPVRSAMIINDLRISPAEVQQLFFGGTRNQAHFEGSDVAQKAQLFL